ncbi:MAG: YbaB/EbfC family nucleoid-associated protein, partial [Clostridia bacterium]
MAKGGFRGGMPGNQMNMMRQAQKMQQDFMKMQQELESSKFEFTAGGGAVKAVVS